MRTKILALGLLLSAAQAFAAVHEVGPGKTFTTIGGAIAHASVVNGDTLRIFPATYLESNLQITKQLTLAGEPAGY